MALSKKAKATQERINTVKAKGLKKESPKYSDYVQKYLEQEDGVVTIVEKDGEYFFNLRVPIVHGQVSAKGKSFLLATSRGTSLLQEKGSTEKKRKHIMYDAEDFQSPISVSYNFMAVIPKEHRGEYKPKLEETDEE